jgi:putative ABC transport system permease protein
MFRAAWRSLVTHKLRLVLSMLAVVLSVGFVVGTFIFSATLERTFTDLFAQTTTDVVVSPESEFTGQGLAGETPTLPAKLLGSIDDVPGTAKVGGTVFADGVAIIDGEGEPIGQGGAPQFGSNWSDDEQLSPYRLIDGVGPTAAGQVAIDSVSAELGDLAVGDTVQLVAPTGNLDAELVGVFRFGTSGNLAGATIAAFDTATAQELLLAGEDAYTTIDAVADEGVSQRELADAVSAVVGSGVEVQTGEEAADDAATQITDALGFFNNLLTAFALVALFVGSFLIVNTFSMLVSQRTREIALLRAVGATRGQIVRSVLLESAIVGLLASIIGCVFGIGVTMVLRAGFGAIGIEMGDTALVLEPSTFIIGLVLGTGVTVFSAWFPGRRASRIPPVAALRDDAAIPTTSLRRRGVIGAVLLALSAWALFSGATSGGGGGFALVGLGTLGVLVGTIIFIPVLTKPVARTLGAPLPWAFGTVGRLAMDNAARQPRRSAATASAVMVGLALVTGFSIITTSASESVTAAVDEVVGAEFLISNSNQRPYPTTVADQVENIDGVEVVSRSSLVQAEAVHPGGGTSLQFPTSVDPDTITDVLDLSFSVGGFDELTDTTTVVDETTAELVGVGVGDTLTLNFAGGSAEFEVVGLYQAEGFWSGFIVTDAALVGAGVDVGDTFVYVKAAEGADLTAIRAGIDEILESYPTVTVQTQTELKEQVEDQAAALLAILIALLGLAIFIAVLGIINTLLLSVLERTREIGMLRAVGATRRQVRRMVILESVVLALFGAGAGIVLGIAFGSALQRALSGFGFTVLGIPWVLLAIFLVIALVVGVLAALWPARRAARLDVLRAVTTE